MPVSAAITFRMAMGSGYVAVMRGTPVTPLPFFPLSLLTITVCTLQQKTACCSGALIGCRTLYRLQIWSLHLETSCYI